MFTSLFSVVYSEYIINCATKNAVTEWIDGLQPRIHLDTVSKQIPLFCSN